MTGFLDGERFLRGGRLLQRIGIATVRDGDASMKSEAMREKRGW